MPREKRPNQAQKVQNQALTGYFSALIKSKLSGT
jgi:hypothetical protein